MSLEALRTKIAAETEALKALNAKAILDSATDDDLTAVREQTGKVKALNERLDVLVAAEKEASRAAAPVDAPTPRRVYAEAEPQIDKSAGFTLGVLMAGVAAVKSGQAANVREALESHGFAQVADRFENLSRSKQLTSSQNTGGLLVPPTMATEIIEFLRPTTAFLQNSPRRVALVNGSYFQAAGNTGASAAYGAENGNPAYSEATFRDVNLIAKELTGKTAVSNRLISRGVVAIRQFVESDLREAMSEAMDRAMFVGNGLQNAPLGIYNIPGVVTRAAQDSQTPTAAQVDADARWAISSIATANINLGSARWTMSVETAGFLEDMRDGNGNFLFPTMQGQNKTWKGYPVSVTTNLPTNLGAGSIRSHISFVAYTHVLFGEEEGITLKATNEGAYTDGAGNMRSTFERNETAMLTIASHDVGVRHLRAIALLTDVRWGRA